MSRRSPPTVSQLRSKPSRQKPAPSAVRMDAVFYCLGALERFAKLQRDEVQRITIEIALLGQTGLDVNDSARRIHLKIDER